MILFDIRKTSPYNPTEGYHATLFYRRDSDFKKLVKMRSFWKNLYK